MGVIAVGIGGFVGAILRYLIGEWLNREHGFPFGTLLINLLGCLVLAWFLTMATHRWKIHANWRVGIGTGLIGAFTTFSTFSVETLQLVADHQFLLAILYVFLSVFGGIGLACIGVKMASFKLARANPAEGESDS